MTDLRQGVSDGVHRVLDVLDRSRDSWGQLSDDGLHREILIEARALASFVAPPAVEDEASAREAARWAVMRVMAAERLAALILFERERAAAPALGEIR